MVDHPALPFLKRNEKGKVVSAADAVKLIRDGDTLATGGFVGIGFAEEIAIAIEQRFECQQALVSVTAYHSFGGEVEASKYPHNTSPQSLMPSPAFADSSPAILPEFGYRPRCRWPQIGSMQNSSCGEVRPD